MPSKKECPHCGGENTYEHKKPVDVACGSRLLQGLSTGLFRGSKFSSVVCRDCGLVRIFADDDALAQLDKSSKWMKL